MLCYLCFLPLINWLYFFLTVHLRFFKGQFVVFFRVRSFRPGSTAQLLYIQPLRSHGVLLPLQGNSLKGLFTNFTRWCNGWVQPCPYLLAILDTPLHHKIDSSGHRDMKNTKQDLWPLIYKWWKVSFMIKYALMIIKKVYNQEGIGSREWQPKVYFVVIRLITHSLWC